MGTRADFYIRDKWLGSIAWDGYPDGIPDAILDAPTEADFLEQVLDFLSQREDSTFVDQGWPWPWDDSTLTDYSYVWDDKPLIYVFGKGNKPARKWPDMSAIKNVRWDKGSGIILIQSKD